MTTIKTTCEHCGDVELLADDLSLELDPNRDSGEYLFVCPTCLTLRRRPANPRVISVLLATGVDFQVITSNVITEAEIASFVDALDDVEGVFKLLAS